MKRKVLLFIAAVLAGSAASALTVRPAGGFSATGRLALGKSIVPVSCLTTFTGEVRDDGSFTVQTVSFSGSNFLCRRISAVGLPWSGHADSDAHLTIDNMQVNIDAPLLGGLCGPVSVPADWEKDGSAAYFRKVRLPPNCSMDGRMATTPHLLVTP